MSTELNRETRRALRRQYSRYYIPEMMGFVRCNACLNIALEHSEQVRKLYEEIKEDYSRPGFQKAIVDLKLRIPSGKKLLEALTQVYH